MLQLWATATTVVNTALAVAGLGVAGYAISAKPGMILFYYAVAFICVVGAVVGFVNMWFLNQAIRRYEEKNRPIREERERKKAERAARKAEKAAAKEAARAEKEAAEAAAAAEAQQEAALPPLSEWGETAPEEPEPPAEEPEPPAEGA